MTRTTQNLVFLKIGGSAITDKNREATAHLAVIRRIAAEIARARAHDSSLALVLGHGSGSFGHYVAKKTGYGEPGNWRAFAETGAAAARLNRIFADTCLAAEIPVVTMQPSASAVCRNEELVQMAVEPMRIALSHGLVPIVYGDVAFDRAREMAITSTEKEFAYLARFLTPRRIILAGNVPGVFTADPHQDPSAQLISEITPSNYTEIQARLRGSHGVDVTGGMLTKVKTMLDLVQSEPSITVRILSAQEGALIERALLDPGISSGTLIHA